MKNQKGITLVALVITIVVLIILAGVAINMTLGENGILTKAKQARNEYINAQIHEEVSINSISEQLSREEKDVEQITLNENTLTIFKGETEQLTATVIPSDATNKNIIWSSSDASIATVENGIITAVGEGNATITATSKSDSTIKASCEITVKNAVEQITLSESSMTISKGETAQLTATVTPSDATNKNIIWSSSNTSVATVENGIITAVEAGTTIITATSEADTSITASCEIMVENKVYLYKDGEENTTIAGAFQTFAERNSTSNIVRNESSITLNTNCSQTTYYFRGVSKRLELDGEYTKLCITVTNANLGSATFFVGNYGDSSNTYIAEQKSVSINSNTEKIYELDITGIKGSKLIGINTWGTNTTNITFSKIWLEK